MAVEEDLRNMHLSKENAESDLQKSKLDNSLEMTEQEMSQHLSLCLKLAAENKINTKNAFGLHLIDIMRRMMKQNAPDLQAASMSLQASSKIYAGRVEALYKDTCAFHYHLQTIVFNKNAKDDRELNDNVECEDDDGRERRKSSKSKQTYLSAEETVTLKSEVSCANSNPHSNFITIKSAFTASRTDPKLLDGLVLENDSCKMCCTKPALCLNPLNPATISELLYTEKCKNLIKKAQNLRTEFESALTSSDVFFDAPQRSPPPPPPDFDLNSDDSFCIGTTPVQPEPDGDVQDIIQRFSVLDITANLFANEVSLAIVDDRTVDRHLLPPNSALKRILNTTEKRLKKTPAEKVRKEKPPKEPFFNRQRVVDKSILNKGRKIELTDNDVSKWQLGDTADLHCGGHEKFSTVLAEHYDETTDQSKEITRVTYNLIQDKMQQPDFERYFCKPLQLWNRFRRQANACLIRPSSFGVCLRNEGDSRELSVSSETNSNGVVQSFQNLSLHNSQADSDDDNACLPPDAGDMPDIFSPEPHMPTRPTRNSGYFEDDLKSMMVTPPELVKPVNMKFQTEPITLNTEKVKNALWDCIKEIDVILLSEVHKKLEIVFVKDKLPLQYVFTMLLLLSNEKCLLLKTISNGADVEIMKDILEDGISEI